MPRGIYKHTHMMGNKLRAGKPPINKRYFSANDLITRICFACKQEKPISDFYKSGRRYFQRECKECTKERRSVWWKSDKGKRSNANTKLKKRFGITIEQYEKMLKEVDGRCQICGATNSYNGHRLAIDHDHKSRTIRGILCKACNIGIASFSENTDNLKRAIEYLRTYEKVKGVVERH